MSDQTSTKSSWAELISCVGLAFALAIVSLVCFAIALGYAIERQWMTAGSLAILGVFAIYGSGSVAIRLARKLELSPTETVTLHGIGKSTYEFLQWLKPTPARLAIVIGLMSWQLAQQKQRVARLERDRKQTTAPTSVSAVDPRAAATEAYWKAAAARLLEESTEGPSNQQFEDWLEGSITLTRRHVAEVRQLNRTNVDSQLIQAVEATAQSTEQLCAWLDENRMKLIELSRKPEFQDRADIGEAVLQQLLAGSVETDRPGVAEYPKDVVEFGRATSAFNNSVQDLLELKIRLEERYPGRTFAAP